MINGKTVCRTLALTLALVVFVLAFAGCSSVETAETLYKQLESTTSYTATTIITTVPEFVVIPGVKAETAALINKIAGSEVSIKAKKAFADGLSGDAYYVIDVTKMPGGAVGMHFEAYVAYNFNAGNQNLKITFSTENFEDYFGVAPDAEYYVIDFAGNETLSKYLPLLGILQEEYKVFNYVSPIEAFSDSAWKSDNETPGTLTDEHVKMELANVLGTELFTNPKFADALRATGFGANDADDTLKTRLMSKIESFVNMPLVGKDHFVYTYTKGATPRIQVVADNTFNLRRVLRALDSVRFVTSESVNYTTTSTTVYSEFKTTTVNPLLVNEPHDVSESVVQKLSDFIKGTPADLIVDAPSVDEAPAE